MLNILPIIKENVKSQVVELPQKKISIKYESWINSIPLTDDVLNL